MPPSLANPKRLPPSTSSSSRVEQSRVPAIPKRDMVQIGPDPLIASVKFSFNRPAGTPTYQQGLAGILRGFGAEGALFMRRIFKAAIVGAAISAATPAFAAQTP